MTVTRKRGVTYFVKLMKAKGNADHDDSEGTIVSPSVASWTWHLKSCKMTSQIWKCGVE